MHISNLLVQKEQNDAVFESQFVYLCNKARNSYINNS